MKLFFGALSNDELILRLVLRASALDGHMIYQATAPTATQGWNQLLDKAEEDKADVAVLCHNDMYFPPGWVEVFQARIADLPPDWMIAGFFGVNEAGEQCGRIHDRRVPFPLKTPHPLPAKAIMVDGCAFAVNVPKKFRFEEMPGYDLYDLYMSLRAKELGGTTWIIDAMPEHYPRRPIRWKPDANFLVVWEWLRKRFPGEKLITTCHADGAEKQA